MTASGNTPTGIQLAPGTLLVDRYKITKRIGGGGMGSVYLAEDQNLANRPVAVKEMVEMFADDSARTKAIEDFKREAELLARLDHPSIPTIYQYFFDTERGRYYLVMKYIDGGDLAARQRTMGGKVDEATVTKWAIDTCDVLDYIHSQTPPIIYRDLKPANLMIDARTNRVMLVDFGIARFVAPTQKGVTAIGTMGYAPPELFAGNVQPQSDIYSLGATMFHLMTGVDPQDNPLLIFDFTKNPKPRQINPAISVEMEELVCRSVEHKPENRFPTARAFGQELQAHLRLLQDGKIGGGAVGVNLYETSQSFGPVNLCVNCVRELATDDVFCAYCGTRQPSKRTTAKLVVMGTSEMNAQFALNLEGESLIGRLDPNRGIRPEVDLSKYDPSARVSRRHARILAQGTQFFIEDLGSANGTVVNGSLKLPQGKPHMLVSGDELKLGETTLKFVVS
ncbi:MAG TPA: FHA domain-containing serine/threonine-protein kinase [Blastocatellia bacterium]|nr:FHA domain-containing serine/threonine-protein kinase [Blastocatellia bacterium]HMY73341.1 FHA domain-containing serine/threonine-protein kinase [Blastocatellia bacterium]HMZ23042.1 FHA domain-containing serine/threonine-protein kinase [Blastocatellia bacterium]HNG32187.1 FHA domain-containing serine/threonine-protein kinase [Blastocatellia bacterium]